MWRAEQRRTSIFYSCAHKSDEAVAVSRTHPPPHFVLATTYYHIARNSNRPVHPPQKKQLKKERTDMALDPQCDCRATPRYDRLRRLRT
jgi:hypothetical protein